MDIAHSPTPRLALIGDRSAAVRAHQKISTLLPTLGGIDAEPFDAYWLHSSTLDEVTDLSGFDGIWVTPGSPYENLVGVLQAIHTARTLQIPFLGTCGGCQHMLLEFARNACGLTKVEHAEINPEGDELLLVPLECSLLGVEDAVTILAATRAAAAMGAGGTTERFFCRFGMNASYVPVLQSNGLVISGIDESRRCPYRRVARTPVLRRHVVSAGAVIRRVLAAPDAASICLSGPRTRRQTCIGDEPAAARRQSSVDATPSSPARRAWRRVL